MKNFTMFTPELFEHLRYLLHCIEEFARLPQENSGPMFKIIRDDSFSYLELKKWVKENDNVGNKSSKKKNVFPMGLLPYVPNLKVAFDARSEKE